MQKRKFANNGNRSSSSRISTSDDLRPEYDFAESRPNPYANRPKIYRGGVRAGAGRKPIAQLMERHTITMHPSDAKYLRSLDTNLSKAVRKLIAQAR
jgi:hypothetical protein